MIRTVVQSHLEIRHGIAGHEALFCRLDYSFFDSRNVLFRNCSAEYLIDELELLSARKRLDLNPTVAKLPVPTRLFFVSTLCAGDGAHGFPIRNLRRF